jgi:hypothetical protein
MSKGLIAFFQEIIKNSDLSINNTKSELTHVPSNNNLLSKIVAIYNPAQRA